MGNEVFINLITSAPMLKIKRRINYDCASSTHLQQQQKLEYQSERTEQDVH